MNRLDIAPKITAKPSPWELLASEAKASAIPIELMKLNAIALDESESLDYLMIGDVKRLNTGAISSSVRKQYKHLADGGVWYPGWSIDCGYDDPWGVLKPVTPKIDRSGKARKYETPPKYPWAKIPIFLPRPTKELEQRIREKNGNKNPELAWAEWLMANDTPLAIVEGAKKAMSVLAQGLPCIGIYSMWAFKNKKMDGDKAANYLKPSLEKFFGNREKVYFITDNDKGGKQRRMCESAVGILAGLIESLEEKCNLQIVDFSADHPEKGIDDVIASILKEGDCAYSELVGMVQRSRDWIAWMQWRKANRTHLKPEYYVGEKYLDWLSIRDRLTPEKKIIGIKSPKGTGKTEVIKSLVRDNKKIKKQTIVITHRESLSRAIGKRCGLPYWRDARNELLRYGFSICVDSVRPFSEFGFYSGVYEGQDVVIDEIDQVIKHLLESSTCREHRVQIFEEFKKLLRVCDRLFVLDADLSTNALQLLQDLSGKKPMVFENRWADTGYPVEMDTTSNPYDLVGSAINAVRSHKRILFLCDSMKAKSKYGTTCLESLFREQCPGAKVLRIDSSSLADPYSDAYGALTALDAHLADYDVVIASPSIGTGVSIDLHGHFDECYAILWGVLSPDGNRQFLARLRDRTVPRKVWIAHMGLSGYGNGSDNPKVLAAVNTRKFNNTLKRLGVKNVWDEEGDRFCSDYMNAFYRMAALKNYERYRYRPLFRSGLKMEGCTISTFKPNHGYEKDELLDIISANKDKVYSCAIQRELDADDISEAQFKSLEKSDTLDLEEQAQLSKHKRQKKYCTSITRELIVADDKGLYPHVKLLYLLGLGKEADEFDREKLDAKKEENIFLPDISRGVYKLKTALFEFLGLSHFTADSLEVSNVYCEHDDAVKDIGQKCRDNYQSIRDILGVKINSEWSNIRIISHILKRCLGVGLNFESRSGGRGERVRYYASALIPELYHRIIDAWRKRGEEVKQVAKESKSGDRTEDRFVLLDVIDLYKGT